MKDVMVLVRWEPGAFGVTGWGAVWLFFGGSSFFAAIAARGRK